MRTSAEMGWHEACRPRGLQSREVGKWVWQKVFWDRLDCPRER